LYCITLSAGSTLDRIIVLVNTVIEVAHVRLHLDRLERQGVSYSSVVPSAHYC
jgi:hypothetical protein